MLLLPLSYLYHLAATSMCISSFCARLLLGSSADDFWVAFTDLVVARVINNGKPQLTTRRDVVIGASDTRFVGFRYE